MLSLRRTTKSRPLRGGVFTADASGAQPRSRGAIAVAVALTLLSPLFVAMPSASAADLVPVVIDLSKTVDVSTPSPRSAGNNVSYSFTVTCSSTQTDCVNLKLTDSFPAPLTFVSVAPNPSKYDIGTAPNGFVLTFKSVLDEGGIGLVAGETVSFTATGQVPTNVDASYDGTTVTNTAYATVDNPDSNNQDSADIVINSPFVPGITVTKNVTPESVKNFTGEVVNFGLSAQNTSNSAVSQIVIQDPAAFPTNAYDYVAVTGLSGLVKPSPTSLVLVEWWNGTAWRAVDNDTNPNNTVLPVATPTLTATNVGAPLSSIKGLRFTFTEPGTGVIAKNATAGITVVTATTSAAAAITAPFTATNIVSARVATGFAPNVIVYPVVTAQDTYVVRPASIALVPAKTFSTHDIVGGQDVTVTLTGQNGVDYDLDRMDITEPKPGTTSLADQGISFSQWNQAGVVWPAGATTADVSYTYNTAGVVSTSTSTGILAGSSLPAPTAGETVESFTVSFHGVMGDNAKATLPFTAKTSAVTAANVNSANTTNVTVHTTNDLTATADATDTLTRRSARINTTITKNVSPGTIFANSGTPILISLPSRVDPAPTSATDPGGSTVGVESVIVTDVDADFWDAFNAAAIVGTAVPGGSKLSIQYTVNGGSSWVDLPGAIALTGPSTFTSAIPGSISSVANGIRFVYTPAVTGTLLPPGFSTQPNIRATLRSTLRSDPSTAVVPGTADVPVVNDATIVVENPVATPSTASDIDDATIAVRPLPAGGGPGYDQLEKVWNDDFVQSRSSGQASATISWGTAGLEYDRVVITDDADNALSAAGDPSLATITSSVYEAFDLVSINAITSATDPYIASDRVVGVELFRTGTNSWVPIGSNPCAGTACYGTFPGATLSTAERADTISARLVFAENPNRTGPTAGNPSAPLVGTGVAPTTGLDRHVTFTFQLRDVRRSATATPEAVLGQTRHAQYNAYAGTFETEGLVDNSASLDGIDLGDPLTTADDVVLFHEEDADSITILDSPINLSVTKTWTDGPLGRPVADSGVPQSLYPSALMTIAVQNVSAVPINQMRLVEPTMSSPDVSPFQYFNVTKIEALSGTSASATVTLTKSGVVQAPVSLATATGYSAAFLADVTAIQLDLAGRILADEQIGLVLQTQLREFVRGTTATPVPLGTVPNTVTGSITDPGGLETPATAGGDNTKSLTASATVDIEEASYFLEATKTITADTVSAAGSPAIQYDGNSKVATVRLTGTPSGTARTTRMEFTDATPTFWNAYNFDSIDASPGFTSPTDRVQIDFLMAESPSHNGIVYDTSSGITSTCVTAAGSALDADCWLIGSPSATIGMPALPAGYTKSDIRGVRFTFTKADGSAWERPFDPTVVASFTVERREFLVSPSTTRVPSTLSTYVATPTPGLSSTPAPGESVAGEFHNTVEVVASAALTPSGPALWSRTANAAAEIRSQHLPARVTITKTPFAAQSLGSDIPYIIAVTNSGSTSAGAHDKPLGDLVIVDTLPMRSGEPLLVFPKDIDTGLAYDPTVPAELKQVITYSFTNAAGVAQTTGLPTIAFSQGPVESDKQKLTFTVDPSWKMPVGWTLAIEIRMQFVDGLDAGYEVLNTATVSADQVFDTCNYSTDGSLAGQTVGFSTCTSSTRVWPLPSAPVTIVKGVRGLEAGPLDPDGVPLANSNGDVYDDLGILKTVQSSKVSCDAPNVSTGLPAAAEYYRYPCVPITRPGGYEEWANTFTNGGNIGLTKLVAIDVLPAANDRGVIVNEARSSKWTPALTSYPEIVGMPVGASFDVYYVTDRALISTRCNGADIQNTLGMSPTSVPAMTASYQACLNSSSNPDDIAERNAAWTLLPTTTAENAPLLKTIVALKFVLKMDTAGDLLSPGEKVSFVYRSQTAASIQLAETASATTGSDNLDRDSIAYNSIAAAAAALVGTTEVANRFVTEPRKVGVAMATGEIEISKLVTGAASAFAPNNFAINLSCVSAGVPITIPNSVGVSRSPITVPKNSTVVVRGLPLYADCTISEAPSFGQTSSAIDTPIVQAQQAHSTLYDVHDPNPVFGASRPAIELSTVTNTYDMAKLSVSKVVTATGRTTEGGTGVPNYNAFVISVSCSYDNGTGAVPVLTLTNQALAANGTWTSGDLPAGSVCTVTETTRRNAATIDWKLVQGAGATETAGSVPTTTAGGATAGRVPAITLTRNNGTASTNALTITNNFTSFPLTVNKVVAGAWAANHDEGSFTITVSCTLAVNSGTAVNVFTGSATFTSPGTLTHTFDNIATGAVCTVNEPVSGAGGAVVTYSATTATMSQARTITVTNTFNNASLDVTKSVQSTAVDGDGDPVYVDAPYVATVACVFGPSATPVYSAEYPTGTATLTFTEAELGASRTHTESLTGYPAGASCTVTETSATPGSTGTNVTYVGTTTGSPNGKTATFALSPIATRTNTAAINNNYGVAHFIVEKSLKGAGAAQFGTGSFTIDVVCSVGSVTSYTGTVTLPLPSGEYSYDIGSLAAGSECTAVESNFAATGADAVVYKNGAGTVISSTTPVAAGGSNPRIVVENWYLSGEVTVTKTVTGAGSAAYGAGPFEVTLTCALNGTPVVVLDPVRTLDADPATDATMTTTYTGLPTGSVCKIVESNDGGATSSRITVDGDTYGTTGTGFPFTIDTDASVLEDNQVQDFGTLAITNSFALASLSVTKAVDADAVNQDGDEIEYGLFPISIACTFEGNDVFGTGYDELTPMQKDLAEDDIWTLEGLPAGADCDVTENNTMDAVDTTFRTVANGTAGVTTAGSDASLILGATGANSVLFTNAYEVGSLSLSKVVAGLGRDDWGTATFVVDVSCELTDASGTRSVWDDSYEFTKDSTDAVLIEDLATGAVCTIEESTTGSATQTVIDVDGGSTAGTIATATISDSATPVAAVVTNTFDYTSVEVTKTRDGDIGFDGDNAWDLWGVGPFEVTLSCTFDGNPITIPGGATRELDGTNGYLNSYEKLPVGADCAIDETKTGAADVSVVSDPAFTTTAGAYPVEVTNSFYLGDLSVQKSFVGLGTGVYGTGMYEVTLTCEREVDGVTETLELPNAGIAELTDGNGYAYTYHDLPVGAECSMEETKTGWSTSQTVGAPVTITRGTADPVSINVENDFQLGTLALSKEILGVFSARAAGEFNVTINCWAVVNGTVQSAVVPGGNTRTVRPGEVTEFEELPVGTTCDFDESGNGGADMGVYSLNGIVQLNPSVDVPAGASTVALTNLYILAHAGTDSVIWILAAMVVAGTGILLIVGSRRRKKQL